MIFSAFSVPFLSLCELFSAFFTGMVKKQKIVLPPDLPPEINEDEIEVSDDDLQFVNENQEYAGFVSRLDTVSITKYVFRSLIFELLFHL